VPGRCWDRAGLATGVCHDVDSARKPRRSARRDGGVTPRAPPAVLGPTHPLVPVVSRYWHGQAHLVAAVVRQART
jgi:hypothetical protein